MKSCNVCRELNLQMLEGCDPRYQLLISSGKNIIYASEDFVVIPSLGPLNDSHVMIVPKKHVNNFSVLSVSELEQVDEITKKLISYASANFGRRLVFFESGAGVSTSHSGGCIVHAHIHCVYESEEFESRLFDEVDFKVSCNGRYEKADASNGYVWYMNSEGKSYLCNAPQLPSQFLRYIYSAAVGDVRFWNWRRHNNYEGVLKVLDNYGGFSVGT
ncbi:HIT family protein [Pseudomonas sp. TNT2022 ID642]|uniref:HIT family protein n=1 Tax=Pseudomonas sp. TNT2022 ID642 TaxID=2942632 RepID=UPI002361BF96|nr:HIT domain-containing protein [Pseudomonas sp. TNT2022 ID642]MDD1002173.1 HIT domain-containing protein [Pseudomonas sp. TNT2022 ID642]